MKPPSPAPTTQPKAKARRPAQSPARSPAQNAAQKPARKAAKPPSSPPAAKATQSPPRPATPGQTNPRFFFVQSDSPAMIQALRGLLVAGRMHNCGMILDDRIAGPFNFYRYLYTRVAQQPRLIHPDHHPRLFSDFLDALPGLAGKATAPGAGFLLILPLVRPRGQTASTPLMQQVHARLRRGEARLLHVTTRNKLRLMAESRPGADLPVDRLPALLRAHQQRDNLLQKSLAALPNSLHLGDSDLFAPDGQLTEAGKARLAPFLPRPAALPATSRPAAAPVPLSRLLPNLAAIAGKLRDTPFAWMAEDPAPTGIRSEPQAEPQPGPGQEPR